MKNITTIGLLFGFSLFLGLGLATPGRAEEFYAYKDRHGNLVISNKLPPTGSIVLKRYNLPQPADRKVQQPQEGSDTQQKVHSEDSAKPSKNK